MMLLPAIWTSGKVLSAQFVLGDCVALLTLLVAASVLSIWTFREARKLCELARQTKNESLTNAASGEAALR
jgi:hypothetical protein